VAVAALGAIVIGIGLLALVLPTGGGQGGPLLPSGPRSGLAVPPPVPLDRHDRRAARWAPVRVAVVARTAPDPSAPALAKLETTTPEGTANLVLVLRGAKRRAGALWVRARLPAGDGDRAVGWVPRWTLGGYRAVVTRLVVEVDARRATLFRRGRVVMRAPVAVGREGAPTPRGEFYVRDRLERYASPFYGPLAFGTSARSRVTDWPAGGFVGIHGTDQPQFVPGNVSMGCIRMRNVDVQRLGRLMPVGTPLTIR
jgi:lipoprotein-anchoring transpeptidase ErfK/SrfK